MERTYHCGSDTCAYGAAAAALAEYDDEQDMLTLQSGDRFLIMCT